MLSRVSAIARRPVPQVVPLRGSKRDTERTAPSGRRVRARTRRIVASSSLKPIGLVMWAAKPASRLRRMSSIMPKPLTAIAGVGRPSLRRPGRSRPLPSGRPRSLTIRSNSPAPAASTAAASVPAVATRCPRPRKIREKTASVSGSSSTRRIDREETSRTAAPSSFGPASTGRARPVRASSSTRNVAPRPGPWLSAVRVPSCASTIPRLIARPRPSPPSRRTSAVPCWNGSKIRSRASRSIPWPVSANSTASRGRAGSPPVSRVRTDSVPPGGVNFTAFLIRFQKTCWSRAPSART